MILTGLEIKKRVQEGSILIDPFDEKNINPNSYNLTLHPEIEIFESGEILDMKKDIRGYQDTIPESGLVISPGELILGRTVEYTESHGVIPFLEGRSSIARLGLCIHQTAGFGDLGFKGVWTLELSCVVPIRIYPYTQVCQIAYMMPHGSQLLQYRGKYQGARVYQRSRLHTELTPPEV